MAQVPARLASRRPPYMRMVDSRGATAKRRVVSYRGNRTWRRCGSEIEKNQFTPGRATGPSSLSFDLPNHEKRAPRTRHPDPPTDFGAERAGPMKFRSINCPCSIVSIHE